jgi:hypothetical protein
LSDTLHFSVACAAADTVTTIGVTFSIKGQLTTSGSGANGELFGNFLLGSSGVNFDLQNNTGSTGNKTIPKGLTGGLDNGV